MYRTVLLLALGFATSAQAQPATVTLACKGTTMDTLPAATDADDVTILFSGHDEVLSRSTKMSIQGTIDRVTGDVEAQVAVSDPMTGKARSQLEYKLQCRPTQRMF
jgi:hypothetical protein